MFIGKKNYYVFLFLGILFVPHNIFEYIKLFISNNFKYAVR